MFTFPEDATTSTGAPFWSAPKRFPQALTFSADDPSHAAFVQVTRPRGARSAWGLQALPLRALEQAKLDSALVRPLAPS